MSEKQTVHVTVNGKIEEVEAGALLSDLLCMEKPCGGRGSCGKCKVIATGDLSAPSKRECALLSDEERRHGVRLACMTRITGACEIRTLVSVTEERILTDTRPRPIKLDPCFSAYGVAIDVGTTTLAARLYDAEAHLLSEVAAPNAQGAWGADVISRVEAAMRGEADALAGAIRRSIDGMIRALAQKAGILQQDIDGAVITGNTVMLSLLTGESVEPFACAPFDVKCLFGEVVTARSLALSGLCPDTPIYLPPCISAFVGADITCAILASGLCEAHETAMLVDIGTNGEMVLCHDGKLMACSTAAGPAFEGVGISMGMRGAGGAIDQVTLRDGAIYAHVIGEGTPRGICGSGLVDAAACMLGLNVLDESGFLEDDPFVIEGDVALTQKDIRMLQLAKSAICAGMVTLLTNAGLRSSDPEKLFVAGGFGNYLNPKSAEAIGLIPCALAERTEAIGNAALGGAVMLLLDQGSRSAVKQIALSAQTVELSTSEVFVNSYISGMMLSEVKDD